MRLAIAHAARHLFVWLASQGRGHSAGKWIFQDLIDCGVSAGVLMLCVSILCIFAN